MNDQNLIPNSQRTPEKLREMGQKGGVKSGEVRRKNRELKRMAKWILEEYTANLSELTEVFKYEE